jgi:hypothetical protein
MVKTHMKIRFLRAGVLALTILAVAACGSGAASVPPSTAPSAAPATFDDFGAAFCGAFTSLIRAVGNPDAGTPSIMSKALDDAVAAGDASAADRAATAMLSELEAGRLQVAVAARWQPATATMVQMDRLLVAFEALTTAKRAVAAHAPGAVDPQKAFEQAGGVQAWKAVVNGVGSMPVPSGATPSACPAMSGQV